MALKKDQIIEQSWAAYNQWCEQWRDHAKQHSEFKQYDFADFQNIGVGKALLLCANGYSLEENIEVIKEHQDNVDIMACDKTLGNLLDNGITPEFCMVCDANVDYEKYCEPWKDKLQDTVLFVNVCANPKWTKNPKWKKIVFFVNQDSIKSEVEFSNISGCTNFIPAATNVSGAMLVLATQCNNKARNNYFGYDKILLIGFDYSWRSSGKYYAFDKDASGKASYMKHILTVDRSGGFCYTSHNLDFSSKWLRDYIKTFQCQVVLCSPHTILEGAPIENIETALQYKYKPEDSKRVRSLVKQLNEAQLKANQLRDNLVMIGKDHWLNYKYSI